MEVNEPILEYSQLDLNGSYTYADYLRWQFKERVELIRGKILRMSPAPNTTHQRLSRKIAFIFQIYLQNKPCEYFAAPFDVRLPVPSAKKDSTVVQPDLCIVCNKNKIDEQGCNGAPDLVVEILSPGNTKHEMSTKFKLYEESGVKEYWLVQPDDRTIFVYTLSDGIYIGMQPFMEGQIVQSPLFPDMNINVDEVFENI